MRASDLMSDPVRVCGVGDSCEVAARHMWDGDCGCVVVTNGDGTVAGVVTDRDVCVAAWTTGRTLAAIPVREVMTSPARTVMASDAFATIVETMAREQVRRLPVIDGEGVLVGLISTADVVREHVAHGLLDAETLLCAIASISRSRHEPPPALPAPVPPPKEPVVTIEAQPKATPTPTPTPTTSAPAKPVPQAAAPPSESKPRGRWRNKK